MQEILKIMIDERKTIEQSGGIIINPESKTMDVRKMVSPNTFKIGGIGANCAITNIFKENPTHFSTILGITQLPETSSIIQKTISCKQILYILLSDYNWSLIEKNKYRPRILFEKSSILYNNIPCHQVFMTDEVYLSQQQSGIEIKKNLNNAVTTIDLTKLKKPSNVRLGGKEMTSYAFELYKKYKDTLFKKEEFYTANSKIFSIDTVQHIFSEVLQFESNGSVIATNQVFNNIRDTGRIKANIFKKLRNELTKQPIERYNHTHGLYQFLTDQGCTDIYAGSFYESLDRKTKEIFIKRRYNYQELKDINTLLSINSDIYNFIVEVDDIMSHSTEIIKDSLNKEKFKVIINRLIDKFGTQNLQEYQKYICRLCIKNFDLINVKLVELFFSLTYFVPPSYNNNPSSGFYDKLLNKTEQEVDEIQLVIEKFDVSKSYIVNKHRLRGYIINRIIEGEVIDWLKIKDFITKPQDYKRKYKESLEEKGYTYELTLLDTIILGTVRTIKTYGEYKKIGGDALRNALSIDMNIPYDRNKALMITDETENIDQETIRLQMEKYLSGEEYNKYLEGEIDEDIIKKIKSQPSLVRILKEIYFS